MKLRALVAAAGCVLMLVGFAPAAAAKEGRSVTVQGGVRFVPLGRTALAEAGSARYRGVLDIAPAPKGGLSMVNELAFEDYLKGIAEVPGRWPTEALRAQAIAARTYVLWELARGRSPEGRQLAYDICATVACQVYRGLDNESGPSGAAWADAVESTRSVAVTHGGKPILARYHSTSGGRTRNNEDVFTSEGSRPYLKAVDSPHEQASPLFKWTSKFQKTQLEQILAADKEVPLKGSLVDIRFVKHPDGSAKPNEVVIVGSSGETTVRAATFSRVVSREAKERWPAEYPPANPAFPGSKLPDAVPSSNMSFRIEGEVIVVEGSGWGHGVGMSQYGSLGMAESGMSAEEILKHFYSDTAVEKVDEPEVVRVGIGTGAQRIVIEGSDEFRIESPDGKVIAERALGKYTIEPKSRGAISVRFPDGSDSDLVLSDLALSRSVITPEDNELAVSYAISRPAVIDFEVRKATGSEVVYASDEKVADHGTAKAQWPVMTSDGRRPPSGDYILVLVARSPGGTREASVPFSLESPPAPQSGGAGGAPLIVLAGLGLVIGLVVAVTLIRRS